ncbi:hypothetical protein K2173_002589 [Erythroxylum novogranatense]|uniref:Cytochrome P450 n=1 Tax=Erythroxylum novogranatense TaxID=1862640 RepID=A0AAV8TT06_9ROSI|nr:hypothetical protein K2173_002589 [Erythroxylum novogranatense]
MDTTIFLAISFLFLFLAQRFHRARTIRKNLPPSPPGLPIIGHLHLQEPPMYLTYYNLAKKYGPIFSLRFGSRTVVVVSSTSTIEECFTKNDIVLANRSKLLVGKYLGYNYTAIDHTSYGEHWRNLRRISASEFLSNSRLNLLESIRKDEVKQLVTKLSRESMNDFAEVELKSVFRDLSFNILMRMTAGKRYFGDDVNEEETREFQKLMMELPSFYDTSNPRDFFPIWSWIDGGRFEKRLRNVYQRMDNFMQNLVEACRDKLHPGSLETLVNNLLVLQKSDSQNITDEIIKGFISSMIFAGTEAIYVTLEWAMASVLKDSKILIKSREEIDNIIGQDCKLEENDLSKLPYLQNIILEALRMFPSTPVMDPHMASEDCTLAGYNIPRGTVVLANAWALHRDPSVWDDPNTFKPERFEGIGDGAIKNFIPFGMGRRSCPGMNLGYRVLGLALGSLIQCFDWRRVPGDDIDMRGGSGSTMPKVIPLKAMCKARPVVKKILS